MIDTAFNLILNILNWIIIFIYLVVFALHTIGRKKDWFTSATYISIGILFPLVLYFFRWSFVIQKDPSNGFYWLFICLFALSSVFQLSTRGRLVCEQQIELKSGRAIFVGVVNIFWLITILFNNLYCSGTFFPSLAGIDSHVDNAPILMYFVRSTYAVIALDILCYIKFNRVKYLLFAFAQVVLPVVSSGGRMVAAEAAVCGVSLYLFLRLNGYGKQRVKSEGKRKLKLYQIILLVVFGIGSIYALISVGIYRASHFGKYVISYATTIGYTGPLGEVGAWLYGYFVLSINNLNQTILAHAENPNFIGLYSFSSLFFGILQFDNIFGFDGGAAQHASVYSLREATVPTGLWSFYYDYYVLVFIPMVVAFLKEIWLRQKVYTSRKSLIWCVIYFYYIPEWLFMGFTNTIFSVTGITTGVIIYVLLSVFLNTPETESFEGA